MYISEKTSISQKEILEHKYTDKELNSLYSDKTLGSIVEDGKTTFRLFAPNPVKAEVIIFNEVKDFEGKVYPMTKDLQGVWECEIKEDLSNRYYAYRVYSKEDIKKDERPVFVVDPYAKAVASFSDYFNPRKSIVYSDTYDWGNDEWIQRDWRDLIVYEMHIRDLTSHPTSGSSKPGTYHGLIEDGNRGGINYIKSLGVNTVELLPAQEYGYVEIPYNDSLNGRFNTWNPYERNHWGYMTSNYFAPAAYYAEDIGTLPRKIWIGSDGKQVIHFKDMVKAFHQEGIAVMMDVVYNHLSEYELGNLKEIDKEYYFRLDAEGNYIAESYCGNDLKTERPMVRKLIIDSILYWMKEYHIDGFRFDLGKLIDWETIEAVIREAKKINPHVVFVCEPWGGGYDPAGFSLREWGSWNDQIRNGIKGENPYNGLGWIFGKWYGNNTPQRVKSYVRGTLVSEKHGLFQKPEHSVNYLESHDGYTLGDFIRIGLGNVEKNEVIEDLPNHIVVGEQELKLHKLAGLFLFTSQGITMIHEGQEYGRSKVIAPEKGVTDSHLGQIDHNSYNKDNETNYMDFDHADQNKALLDYYKGLIKLRKKHSAFRNAPYDNYKFHDFTKKEFAVAYEVEHNNLRYFVAFNADMESPLKVDLPDGWWNVLADEEKSFYKSKKSLQGKITLNPSSGIVLQKK
ncbi:MAG: alpha-amylase family glycosyl hydrolase [Melioribacteraceae bacterium]|nr:alpha-amylase family glycosyl hydrolase [Melioribacteraceae bacterium]